MMLQAIIDANSAMGFAEKPLAYWQSARGLGRVLHLWTVQSAPTAQNPQEWTHGCSARRWHRSTKMRQMDSRTARPNNHFRQLELGQEGSPTAEHRAALCFHRSNDRHECVVTAQAAAHGQTLHQDQRLAPTESFDKLWVVIQTARSSAATVPGMCGTGNR
mmetsp:Transcript_24956/g.54853  ORF Transcript_24956/g.54853 Transcript_24956/m.54853 type:complete len:161 (+) Transcript_24956:442-924(+)